MYYSYLPFAWLEVGSGIMGWVPRDQHGNFLVRNGLVTPTKAETKILSSPPHLTLIIPLHTFSSITQSTIKITISEKKPHNNNNYKNKLHTTPTCQPLLHLESHVSTCQRPEFQFTSSSHTHLSSTHAPPPHSTG